MTMITQTTFVQPNSTLFQDSDDCLSLTEAITEQCQKLTLDIDIQEIVAELTEANQELGKLFSIFSKIGEIEERIRAKCHSITKIEYKNRVWEEQEEYEENLYKSLLQTLFPGSNIGTLLKYCFNLFTWSEASRSHTAASTVQKKLDLLELGQQVGGEQVGQRLISGDKKHPIYIKVLGDTELHSLKVKDLLQIEKRIDETITRVAPSEQLPSITTEVETLEDKLRSPLRWPLSLMTSVKKFIDEVTRKRPVVNKLEALSLDTWNVIGPKMKRVEGQKLKGEYLSIRLEEPNHWVKISNRLSDSNTQLSQVQNRVWELAQEKQEKLKHLQEGLGRPAGKVGKNYCPVPWTSDVLEVLEGLGLETDILALIRYDLGVFVEEYDWQIVVYKYKLDEDAVTSLKRTVDEIALENNRPLDPITGLCRPWKDDLYQVIQKSGRDATKLLKKEVMKYSVEEVEALVQERTFEIKEQLEVTEQRLSEEQKYREQLQSKVNSLESKINTMQQEFEQKIQDMFNQFIAQTANAVNSNGHQLVTVDKLD
ncbi:hypothetical protein PCC7424_5850 (plasmid) [Gloeothece citriformis PCC 7424]|uniref:Uncharacterized protein n=1 Tax=Gloeothece citriformis (strain PCC 7424) TaxID=65393 RepID=B7KM82_GLOC7|nr:hypothetical protein [Gloeothece citriformis]ACK73904.1 hypothetical protein PCC7424_5850 [Gloeothece citriformis PCC 7424]